MAAIQESRFCHNAVEGCEGRRDPGLQKQVGNVLTETITSEKSKDLGFSLCWITKAKPKENVWDFDICRKCGLLLLLLLFWLVRAQHDHYESKCERKSGGFHLPFHY